MELKPRRPGVGIGIFTFNEKDEVLIGKRLSKEGNSQHGFPGGYLEFGEEFDECAS